MKRAPQISIGKCDCCPNEATFFYAPGDGKSYKRCRIHAGMLRDWDDLTVDHPARGRSEQR
jgi:hypothetical protein